MAAPIIWSGSSAKLLKPILDFFGQAQILSGTVDPTSVATSAPKGSLYLNTSNGNLYRKTDAGSSTNWINVSGSSAPLQYLNFLDGSNPPIETVDSAFYSVRSYQAGVTQNIQATFKVPKGYTTGQQIFCRALFYCASSSPSTVLFTTTSVLVKVGDTYTATTNTRVSTNTAITLGTANTLTQVVFDLTDSSGQINSVAVAPNDVIRVILKRGTDTATNDAILLQDTAEVYV